MGLSFFNAERARKEEIAKTLEKQQPTSPLEKGGEVEPINVIEEEPIAIKKKKKVK